MTIKKDIVRRIVILGGGESGAGAAVLAKTKGFDVFLSDKGKIKMRSAFAGLFCSFEKKRSWKAISLLT